MNFIFNLYRFMNNYWYGEQQVPKQGCQVSVFSKQIDLNIDL